MLFCFGVLKKNGIKGMGSQPRLEREETQKQKTATSLALVIDGNATHPSRPTQDDTIIYLWSNHEREGLFTTARARCEQCRPYPVLFLPDPWCLMLYLMDLMARYQPRLFLGQGLVCLLHTVLNNGTFFCSSNTLSCMFRAPRGFRRLRSQPPQPAVRVSEGKCIGGSLWARLTDTNHCGV